MERADVLVAFLNLVFQKQVVQHQVWSMPLALSRGICLRCGKLCLLGDHIRALALKFVQIEDLHGWMKSAHAPVDRIVFVTGYRMHP